MEFKHVSILLAECLDSLKIRPDGIYVDATLGGAGHSMHIAQRLTEGGRLIAIDREHGTGECPSPAGRCDGPRHIGKK